MCTHIVIKGSSVSAVVQLTESYLLLITAYHWLNWLNWLTARTMQYVFHVFILMCKVSL